MAREPEKGDVVVLYINKFNPENFEKGMAIQSQGFGPAIEESGHDRTTFWVANPEACEIIGIAFVSPGHQADDWHASEHRRKVREQLEPLLEEPTVVKHCKVVGHHRAS